MFLFAVLAVPMLPIDICIVNFIEIHLFQKKLAVGESFPVVFCACMPLPLPYHPQIRNFSLSDLTVTVISGTQSSLIAPHKKK